jgi:hypothetical protein
MVGAKDVNWRLPRLGRPLRLMPDVAATVRRSCQYIGICWPIRLCRSKRRLLIEGTAAAIGARGWSLMRMNGFNDLWQLFGSFIIIGRCERAFLCARLNGLLADQCTLLHLQIYHKDWECAD